jgi:ERCC4-type nuclease
MKDLQNVRGVGPKIAGRIRHLLTTIYPGYKIDKN